MASNTLLTSDPQAVPQPLYSDSSTAMAALGQRVVTPDGRVFRYVKNGAVAMVPGKLYQSAAEVTANENLAVAAGAVGDTSITTTSTVTLTANQLAGGYVVVTTSTGAGYQYQIAGHAAVTSAVVTINLVDPLLTTLAASTSKIDLIPNPFSGVILNAVPVTANVIGVAVYAVGAGNFGWLQTGGVANVLADGTLTVGSLVGVSSVTAGAVANCAATATTPVGIATTGVATTEYGAIKLLIDQ